MGKYSNQVKTNEAWLPMIPSQWELKKIKWSFKERSEKGYPDEPLLVASQNMGVVPKNVYGKRTVEALKDLDKLKLVKVGDYVVSLRSFQGGIEYAYYQGIISPAYTIMRPNPDFCSAYYKFLFKSAPFIKLLTTCVTGIREGQNIDYGKLKNHYIPVPPRAEQDQIVRFLDWKVSEINKLIGIRRKEIQELEDLKSRVIYHTVLGEDNVIENKKDTGIGWIGKVPENWDLRRIKFLFRLRDEKNYKPLSEVNLLSLYSSLGIIQNKDVEYTTGNRARNADGYKIVKANDIVVNIILCWMGAIGMSDYDGVTSPAYDVYTPQKNVCSKYYHYLFRTKPFSNECYKAGKGIMAMRWRVYFPQFSNIVVPFPPLKEQEEIAETLNDKCKGVDTLITIKQEQVGKLRELKSTLISDVVTGKIDVRNIPVPAYEHVDDLTADDGEGNDGETGIPGEED